MLGSKRPLCIAGAKSTTAPALAHGLQQKMVRAGVKAESFEAASEELAQQCDLAIGPKVIERLVQRVGQERIDQRHVGVEAPGISR